MSTTSPETDAHDDLPEHDDLFDGKEYSKRTGLRATDEHASWREVLDRCHCHAGGRHE